MPTTTQGSESKVLYSVENSRRVYETCPKMMTIRQVAKTGLMPEHALRVLLKNGDLPVVFVGKKAFVNYNALCRQLTDLGKKTLF